MKLSRLKQVNNYEVEEWLKDKLRLTSYQKELLHQQEIVRFSPFTFFKPKQKEKVNWLWRLTLLFYSVFLLLLIICLPLTFIITGKWGYYGKIETILYNWENKLNFKI